VLPACFAETLDQIAHCNFARLEWAVFNGEAGKPEAPRQKLFFNLYERFDRRRITEAEDPLREVDCSSCLEHVESLTIVPVTTQGSMQRFSEDAIRRTREKNLDVLIRFGFKQLHGDILLAARYGIWSYRYGGDDASYTGHPYFWEMFEDNPISEVALQVLADEPASSKVLCKGFFATCRGSSWSRNRVQPYWGATTFLIQKLRQLYEFGWKRGEDEVPSSVPHRGRSRTDTVPTNWQMAQWLGRVMVRTAGGRLARLARGPRLPHFMLAVNPGSRPRIDCGAPANLRGFRWITSPRGHFYADPFLIRHLEQTWVFFEDFDYALQKGTIACAELTVSGHLATAIPVLEKPYHLSYPCIFRDGGELYMIPESLGNETVELYRCARFPDQWEAVKVLLRAPAVDTTVWIEDGTYWFFVTLVERRGGGLQLWLLHSRTLTGEWTPHTQNPISTDVRRSRGAGAIYRDGGKLIRPSQDCSGNYGRSFTLNEIVVLNKCAYSERPCVTVEPEGVRHLMGTHTYSHLDRLEVVDGYALVSGRHVTARS